MARSEEATWVGGPRDGETLSIPTGCRTIWMTTTITADGDEDLVLDDQQMSIPIRHTMAGLRIMYYEAERHGDEED